MTDDALVFEQSIEVDVSPEFAWGFRTDISTWSEPPATFHLDGAFADGTQGRTLVPGQPPWVWSIRDVRPGRSFAIEMALDRATIRFEWLFDAVPGGKTQLTHRIILSGTNAPAYREQVESGFASSLSDGMKRIAEQMEQELPLSGGRTTPGVARIGDTVRRPITEAATFVHELLKHLERRGFAGAPRFLGVDGAGREILSFIPGSVPSELGAFSDDQLAAAARLLRQFHDATLDCSLRDGHEVVCHGDASPCNCVFVEDMPAAFIDFDGAHPGSRLEDLSYAAWLWTDIGNDELSADRQGGRLADFFLCYGADTADAISAIIAAQRSLSARTDSPGVREWSNACRAWVEVHRDALITAITARARSSMEELG